MSWTLAVERPAARVRVHRETESQLTAALETDLVVLSHLRWTFVWQRPQHLISRLGSPGRTWFVEEPWRADVDEPRLLTEAHGALTRVWLEVPRDAAPHVGFDGPAHDRYKELLLDLLPRSAHRVVWLYTPVALDMARVLDPDVLVYDVMDDLAAFKGAPPNMVLAQRQALSEAHVVFTGGRSLYASVLRHRPDRTYLFPSGVEPDHYARARSPRRAGARPVAGYVGVIDERIDLGLVAELADRLPGWEIRMVGPVVKIDEALLPHASNLTYAGPKTYEELPDEMAAFDVALMPFALNEATRSISPTKTLEYLAAGLPVVSTPVHDVVADYEHIVDLQTDGAGFAAACERVRAHCAEDRARKATPILRHQHWDSIAERMSAHIRGALVDRPTVDVIA